MKAPITDKHLLEMMWERFPEIMKRGIEQPAQKEPVAFLANGTRFKISYDSRQSGGQIHGIPPELGGRWVAFVAADDDCHLKLTSQQPAQRKPQTLDELWRFFIERAHGIKENT